MGHEFEGKQHEFEGLVNPTLLELYYEGETDVLKGKFEDGDKVKNVNAVQETLDWFDKNEHAEKNDLEGKLHDVDFISESLSAMSADVADELLQQARIGLKLYSFRQLKKKSCESLCKVDSGGILEFKDLILESKGALENKGIPHANSTATESSHAPAIRLCGPGAASSPRLDSDGTFRCRRHSSPIEGCNCCTEAL